MRFLLLLSVAAEVQGQPDPAELLKLAQAKIVDSLNRLPRYMCTQTIDRSVYVPDVPSAEKPCDENGPGRSLHLLSSDRLRLDVSTVSTGEMYSWVGQRRFDDRDLLEMVDYGSIETGEFAAFLSEIFQGDHARFTYNGRTVLDGRTLAEFGFRVSYENSRYSFGNGQHRVITGYDGTFLIDPTTTDLLQLIVRTNQLPSETGTCYASTTLNYARVHLEGDNVLLPANLSFISTQSKAAQRRTARPFPIVMSFSANRLSRLIHARVSPIAWVITRYHRPHSSGPGFLSGWLWLKGSTLQRRLQEIHLKPGSSPQSGMVRKYWPRPVLVSRAASCASRFPMVPSLQLRSNLSSTRWTLAVLRHA